MVEFMPVHKPGFMCLNRHGPGQPAQGGPA